MHLCCKGAAQLKHSCQRLHTKTLISNDVIKPMQYKPAQSAQVAQVQWMLIRTIDENREGEEEEYVKEEEEQGEDSAVKAGSGTPDGFPLCLAKRRQIYLLTLQF